MSVVHDPNNRFPFGPRAHLNAVRIRAEGDHMKGKIKVESDGTLLPLGAIAVFPCCEEDLAELVSQVPINMAGELARVAAWRALGMEAPPLEIGA